MDSKKIGPPAKTTGSPGGRNSGSSGSKEQAKSSSSLPANEHNATSSSLLQFEDYSKYVKAVKSLIIDTEERRKQVDKVKHLLIQEEAETDRREKEKQMCPRTGTKANSQSTLSNKYCCGAREHFPIPR